MDKHETAAYVSDIHKEDRIVADGSRRIFELTQVRKRTGELVPFDVTKISSALYRAMDAVRNQGVDEGIDMVNDPIRIADNVVRDLNVNIEAKQGENGGSYVPGI